MSSTASSKNETINIPEDTDVVQVVVSGGITSRLATWIDEIKNNPEAVAQDSLFRMATYFQLQLFARHDPIDDVDFAFLIEEKQALEVLLTCLNKDFNDDDETDTVVNVEVDYYLNVLRCIVPFILYGGENLFVDMGGPKRCLELATKFQTDETIQTGIALLFHMLMTNLNDDVKLQTMAEPIYNFMFDTYQHSETSGDTVAHWCLILLELGRPESATLTLSVTYAVACCIVKHPYHEDTQHFGRLYLTSIHGHEDFTNDFICWVATKEGGPGGSA